MLADGENGSISSKRVITFVATLLVAIAFIANLFWKLTIEEFMYTSMMTIILAGLGTTVAEKFAPKKKD
jgi:FtsH-binding integral membrane protein